MDDPLFWTWTWDALGHRHYRASRPVKTNRYSARALVFQSEAGSISHRPATARMTSDPRRKHGGGECYTIAHHLYTADGERKIMIASLRYLDTYSKVDGAWYFAERKLIVDWMETRTSIAP